MRIRCNDGLVQFSEWFNESLTNFALITISTECFQTAAR